MPVTVTGTPGTQINARCSVPKDGPTVPGGGGDPVTGAGLQAMMASVENDLATIKSTALCPVNGFAMSGNCTIGGTLGVTGHVTTLLSLNLGVEVAQGEGVTALGTGCGLNGTWTSPMGSTFIFSGRVIPRPPRFTVADAGAWPRSYGIDNGKRLVLPSAPASARTITIKSTTGTIPDEAETIEFIVKLNLGNVQYTFLREDSTVIAQFGGGSSALLPLAIWAEFEFTGGAWHLGASSGTFYDGASTAGVIPGTGA